MVTLILASTEQEALRYLEQKCAEIPMASVLTLCREMKDLPVLIRRYRPMGVVIDISSDPERLLTLVGIILTEFPSVAVFLSCRMSKCNQELLLSAMRMGIHGFFPIPFEYDLKNAIERIYQKWTPEGKTQATPSPSGRMTCVLSSKGGSGSTLIATNLAVSLVEQRKSTVLIDLNLQIGDVSLFLDLKPQMTITDLMKGIERLDEVLLMEMMTKHPTGVQVLAAPKRLEEAVLLSLADLQKAYTLLKAKFDWVVIDLPVVFDEPMLGTLQSADEILLVTLLNVPSLRNTRRYLEIFWRLGFPRERVKIVVNRYERHAEGALSLKEAEEALDHPLFCVIPNDYTSVISAINQGVPLAYLVQNTPIVKAFDALAQLLTRPPSERKRPVASLTVEASRPKKGLLTRLFGASVEAK
jgi:pilus assembly protein CpaE